MCLERPFSVRLAGRRYIIARNLPGQRLGAKAWYWFLRNFLSETFSYEWCPEQPCLCRNGESVLMVHVDDILYTGTRRFWNEQFVPKLKEKFTISNAVLGDSNDSISFLKRKLTKMEKGLMLTPGTNVAKLVESFESYFGTVRVQRVACDNSFQLPDVSAKLTSHDAYAYRSTVGGLLYLARDRPDLAFPVKELSSKMASPTATALHRLRKVMGYVKGTPEFAVTIEEPMAGQGKGRATNDAFWILESLSDSD